MDEIKLAGCILLDGQGSILLLHRNTDKYNHWEVPGGKVEPNESYEAAAIRELKEELGVAVRIVRELGHASFVDKWRLHYYWFLAKTDEMPRVCEPDKFDKVAYFTFDELSDEGIVLSEGAKTFLSLVKSGEIRL